MIAEQKDQVKDAVVRLQLNLPAEIEGFLKDSEIKNALKEAYFFTIARDIKRESRPAWDNSPSRKSLPPRRSKSTSNRKRSPRTPQRTPRIRPEDHRRQQQRVKYPVVV